MVESSRNYYQKRNAAAKQQGFKSYNQLRKLRAQAIAAGMPATNTKKAIAIRDTWSMGFATMPPKGSPKGWFGRWASIIRNMALAKGIPPDLILGALPDSK